MELNKTENATFKKLSDVAEAILTRKCRVHVPSLEKESGPNVPRFHHKKLVKSEQTKPRVGRRE